MDHEAWEISTAVRAHGLSPALAEIECAFVIVLCLAGYVFGGWLRGVIS
jgi:hypothetical protein